MTDVQLREAIYRVNHDLVDDTIGPWLRSFDGRPVNDPRLRRPMPTSPLNHVLLGFASAGLDEEHQMVAAHKRSAQRMNRAGEDWIPKLDAAE